MPRRLRQRLIQASILAVVVAAGYGAYTRITRPDPQMLARLAMKQLHDIFGPHVTTGPMDVDLIDGVIIPRLEVRNPAWPGGPTLSARWVKIEHDVVALASGAYVPTWIHIQDATIWTVETEDGIRLAFPFELEAPGRGGTIPRLDLDGGSIHLKPRPGSPHLRASPPIVLGDLEVHVRPEPTGRVRIEGSFTPVDLGHDDVTVEVTGWADPDAHRLELGAVWRPLRVNDALLAALSPQLAAQLGDLGIDEGALTVSLTREPRAGEGEIEVSARFEGTVVEPPQKLPGGILVDARTREQVAEVFQRARIDLRLSERGIDIGRLAPELPEGSIEATGFIADDGRTVDLMVVFKGVRFQDETIRKVLGPEGELVYDEFEPRGVIDVTLHIRKEPGSEISWDAYATIDDGAFRYVGTRNAEGQPQGFPYEMSQVSGVIYFQKDLVQFEDIVGFNGGATVRILSHRDHAWTGGETGRIKLTDAGPDIRITVEAVDVPVDATLQEAIEGSEVGPLLDRFEVEGILDRVLVDVIRDPLRDEGAPAQVRVEFSNERFRYLDFPLVLDDVTGVATMTRPPLPEGGRGHRVTVDVAGEADGAPVSVRADVDLLHKRGRLRVEATNVPLEGEVAQTINTAPLTREGIASVWRYLDPRGRADVLADLPLEDDPDPLQLKIRLLGAAVRLDAEEAELPLVVTDLDGVIAVSGDVVTLEDLRGKLGDDPVRIDGTIRGGTEGEWDLTVKTERLRLDLDLLRRLPHYLGEEHLLPGGLELESGGHLALTLRLRRQAGPGETLHAEVETREVDARLRLPQGSTLALRGKRLAVVGGDVTIEGMRGEAPGIVVKVDTLTAGDGPLVGSFDLVLDEFRTAKGILALAPESTRAFLGQWLESRVLSTEGIHVRTRPDGSVRVDGPLGVLAPEGATEDGSPRGELVFDGLVVESPGGDAPPGCTDASRSTVSTPATTCPWRSWTATR